MIDEPVGAGRSLLSDVIFLVEEVPQGGSTAWAPGVSIFTEADTLDDLQDQLRDAVRCHFDESEWPVREPYPDVEHPSRRTYLLTRDPLAPYRAFVRSYAR